MKTIGIVGCGAVSQGLLKASESGVLTLPVSGITSRTKEKAQKFLSTLKKAPEYYTREKLITKSDLIVEAAGGDVVPDLARETFSSGKDLMVISIGALIDCPDIIELAKKVGTLLRLRGPANLQGILDDSGNFLFTDVNLRFGSGVVHTIHAGANIPRMIFQELAGQSIDKIPNYIKDGSKMFRFHDAIFDS